MSRLNLNRVVNSPAFASCFAIVRTTNTKNDKGRTVLGIPLTIPDQYGSIAVATPQDLKRVPDYSTTDGMISVVTSCRVISLAPGYEPDHITWLGVDYLVISVGAYPQYGPGFWQVLAVSAAAVSRPQ